MRKIIENFLSSRHQFSNNEDLEKFQFSLLNIFNAGCFIAHQGEISTINTPNGARFTIVINKNN